MISSEQPGRRPQSGTMWDGISSTWSRVPPIAQDATCSVASSGLAKTVMAPLERIKLLKSVENELVRTGKLKKPWSGYWDLVASTYKYEGFRSFWKGNATYMARYVISQGTALTVKDQLKRSDPLRIKTHKFASNVFYAGTAGVIGLFFAYPLEYARTRISNDLTLKGDKKPTVRQWITKAWRAEGVRGVYKGYSMSMPTIFVYRGLQLGMYDNLKQHRICDNLKSFVGDFWSRFLLSYVVTIGANIPMYPLNTLRTRFVITTGEKQGYNGYFNQIKAIRRKEGLMVLYRGFAANCFKNLGSALVLAGYDYMTRHD